MSIAIIDTSVFCNLLHVPGRDQEEASVRNTFQQCVEDGVSLLLPIATILETGNHIARGSDGRTRYQAAQRFVSAVRLALDGEAPYTPIRTDSVADLGEWLEEFPSHAGAGVSFADASIIAEFQRQCTFHRARRIYIWSLDHQLSGYDRQVPEP